jgi:hypothetical protein
VSSRRRNQARHKDSVNNNSLLGKKYAFNRLKAGCLKSESNGSGFKVEIFIEKLLVLGHVGSWDDFLDLGHCLLKKDIE